METTTTNHIQIYSIGRLFFFSPLYNIWVFFSSDIHCCSRCLSLFLWAKRFRIVLIFLLNVSFKFLPNSHNFETRSILCSVNANSHVTDRVHKIWIIIIYTTCMQGLCSTLLDEIKRPKKKGIRIWLKSDGPQNTCYLTTLLLFIYIVEF